jgi:hypothetical protein
LRRYGEYLTLSAGQSARLLELYQEVMDHVSRGVLAPSVLQNMMVPFAQARGTELAGRLSDLSMRFLGGLVQVGTAYFQQLAHLAPEAAETLDPPPAFDSTDPAHTFQQLADYANRLRDQSWEAYLSMLRRVSSGDLDPEEVRRAASDHMEEHAPELVDRLGRLYFDLLGALSDLRAAYEEEYLEGVLAGARRDARQAASSLELRAPLGETASGSFTLENTRDEPMTVRCRATDVRRADGVNPAFSPDLRISPDTVQLAPGAEVDIRVSILLSVDDYAPEALYVGALVISRPDESLLEVPVRIVATGSAPPADRPEAEEEQA